MQVSPRMAGQSRIEDLPDERAGREKGRDDFRALLGPGHPDGKRLDPPDQRGLCRSGDMNVLSTTERIPLFRAIRATSRMSAIFMSGLVGVSTKTARVFFPIFFATCPGFPMSV